MKKENFITQTNNKLLKKDKNKLLLDIYFEIQENAEKIYGNNTVVFIEIGSFFEIYEKDNIGKAKEISKELNILLTKKSKKVEKISSSNPYMCGIPSVTLDKYIEQLTEIQKWTIIVIKQSIEIKNDKQIVNRFVDNIISQGVNLNFNNSFNYNFATSLILDKINNIIYAGISFIDVSIGKTLIYEGSGNLDDKYFVIDEIQSFLNKYKSKEIIISKTENITDDDFEKVKNELELEKMNYIINKENTTNISIDYQNQVLQEAYGTNTILSPIEELNLELLPLATKSLINLLGFIVEHNPEIIRNLKKPEILENETKLYCGNQAIKQLNIIEREERSIEKIINSAKTAFGRRYVKDLILNPIKEEKELKQRYKKSEEFINLESELKNNIKNNLFNIYDLERILRMINVNKIKTKSFHNLITSLNFIKLIQTQLIENEFYIFSKIKDKNLKENLEKLIFDLDFTFKKDTLAYFTGSKEDETFIKVENFKEDYISEVVRKRENINKIFKDLRDDFLNCFETNNEEFIPKIKFTEKEGHYLELTLSKYKELQKKKVTNKQKLETYDIKLLKNVVKITTKEIKEASNKIFILQEQLIAETLRIFNDYILDFSKFNTLVEEIIIYLQKLEFYIVNDNLFHQKKYIRPEIIKVSKNEKFLDIKDLRHIIVEEDESKGIFVPNDFMIGDSKYFKNTKVKKELNITSNKVNGIMLHGLNASGKSTLIKSVGVSLILAQAGLFVPATSFRYSIFDTLFTRISGSDNIYKGLSTFTIEMLEMKNIFNRSKNKTLILGDELSNGTETQSAISIVASGFLTLQKMDTLFFFATHLHQLNELEEIKNNKNLLPLHIHVEYNKEKDKFIFDRKLKYGQGLSTYGLEYAKFLNLNDDFIKTAYKIRNKIATDKTNLELLLEAKQSNYNKNVFMKQCSLCDKKAIETHHIKEQHTADENQKINHFHKNHRNNLIPLCEEHHHKIHKGEIIVSGFKTTSNGLELDYIDLANDNNINL